MCWRVAGLFTSKLVMASSRYLCLISVFSSKLWP
jgi:hypothetical protein